MMQMPTFILLKRRTSRLTSAYSRRKASLLKLSFKKNKKTAKVLTSVGWLFFPGSHYEENVTDKRNRQFLLTKTNIRMSLENK